MAFCPLSIKRFVFHEKMLLALLCWISYMLTTTVRAHPIPSSSDSGPAINVIATSNGNVERWEWDTKLRAVTAWSYSDTGAWKNAYPTCGGQSQSPINIEPRESKLKSYPKFTFENYGSIDKMVMVNNGHTVTYTVPTSLAADRIPSISGGGLDGKWNLVQFHLHWGKDSSRGSEHTIRSQKYAAELHLVHYNTKYGSFAEATNHQDGLAVLGIFIKIGNNDNDYFKPVVDQLNQVVKEGDEATLSGLVSLQNLLPSRTTSFYRYSGSLTTPGCSEIVTWTVFDNPISVSESQIDKFRRIFDDDGKNIVDNYRPTLPLNNRALTYRSFTGCEISRTWPFSSSSPIVEALTWKTCVVRYSFSTFLSLLGIGSS